MIGSGLRLIFFVVLAVVILTALYPVLHPEKSTLVYLMGGANDEWRFSLSNTSGNIVWVALPHDTAYYIVALAIILILGSVYSFVERHW